MTRPYIQSFLSIPSLQSRLIKSAPSRGGETGRRAGFKIRFLREWGFESPPRHHLTSCGNSSGVEHNLAKVGVASSNLVSRSIFLTLLFALHLFSETFILEADYYLDRDRVYASDLIGPLEEDFLIGEFGTRSLLQYPASRIKRLFDQEGIAVDTAASIVTVYRLGGVDLAALEAKLMTHFFERYPQMQVTRVHIRPQSVSDITGLELVEVQVGVNQLRRNQGTFQAWFGRGGEGLKRLFFGYEIEAALPVLEADRVIDSGALIDTHNTKERLMAFERLSADPILQKDLGRVTARGRLRQGDVITQNRVTAVPDLRRGARIRVEMVESGVRLSFLATAKSDAMIGEQLEVEDARGRTFRVRLMEKDRARVE